MKKLIFALSISLAACSPGSNNTNVAPAKIYSPVPNWQTDTLIGLTISGDRDTVFAISATGHSFIEYHGVQYELRAYALNNGPIVANARDYFVDVFTAAGSQINAVETQDASASPATYYDAAYFTWKTQRETVLFNFPPFRSDIVGGMWSTLYK